MSCAGCDKLYQELAGVRDAAAAECGRLSDFARNLERLVESLQRDRELNVSRLRFLEKLVERREFEPEEAPSVAAARELDQEVRAHLRDRLKDDPPRRT